MIPTLRCSCRGGDRGGPSPLGGGGTRGGGGGGPGRRPPPSPPPPPPMLAELREGRWPDFEHDSEALSRALPAFRAACAQADLASLQEEHSVLFDRQVRCSPYESSYGDGRRLGGKPVEQRVGRAGVPQRPSGAMGRRLCRER